MGRTGQAAAGGQTLSAPCIRWLQSPEAAPRPWGSWRQGASSLGNAAGTALPCWAGHGRSPGAAGWGCPGSTCSRTLLLQALGWTGTAQGHLWGSASTLHGILEECVSLLTAFWSTVLPVSPAQHQGKVSRGWGPAGHGGRCSLLITLPCPRSRCSRVRLQRCGRSSPRGRMLCRARPGGCAAQPSSRTAWSSSSSASVRGLVAQPSWPGPHVPEVVPSTGTSLTPSLSPAVTRTHSVLRKARTNLEVSVPCWPVWDGGGCPAPDALGMDTFSLSVLSQHVRVPRAH